MLTVEAGCRLLEDRQDTDEIHGADMRTIHAIYNGVATADNLPSDFENFVQLRLRGFSHDTFEARNVQHHRGPTLT